jgi:hypothetical protein
MYGVLVSDHITWVHTIISFCWTRVDMFVLMTSFTLSTFLTGQNTFMIAVIGLLTLFNPRAHSLLTIRCCGLAIVAIAIRLTIIHTRNNTRIHAPILIFISVVDAVIVVINKSVAISRIHVIRKTLSRVIILILCILNTKFFFSRPSILSRDPAI